MRKRILIGVGTLILLAVAYWLLSPLWRNVTLNEELPGAPSTAVQDSLPVMDADTKADFENETTVMSRANMIAQAHDVEGEALLVTSGDETFLRFENLKTINGPDLRIYLSSALNADDIVDLGVIRATEGNVNYTIPAGTDLSKYKNVLIWCRAFGVLFSYAQFE